MTADIAPLDPRAYALLAEEGLGPELFNPTQHVACELVEAYATELAVELCATLDLAPLFGAPATATSVREARGWAAAIAPGLEWVFARLAAAGLLVRTAAGACRLAGSPLASERAAIRARGLEIDPSYAPAYELLDEAAAAFPAIARGETTGERALLGKMGLWIRYFDNRNTYYALNNRVTAAAVATRLPDGGRVLEVGAGLGSATEALLETLARQGSLGCIAAYRATEPVAFFARRAQRILTGLHPDVPLVFAPLDINVPWTSQGIAPASQAVVWGVNVFHLAHDLDAVLREARAALAPGGWLVAGEGMRPAADEVVGAELPFRLLESFTGVRLDPVHRPTPGFLTAEQWLAAFGRAGFREVRAVPDVVRLRAYYPGMLAAAVCGRQLSDSIA